MAPSSAERTRFASSNFGGNYQEPLAKLPGNFYTRLRELGADTATMGALFRSLQPADAHIVAGKLLSRARTPRDVRIFFEALYGPQTEVRVPYAFRTCVVAAAAQWLQDGLPCPAMLDVVKEFLPPLKRGGTPSPSVERKFVMGDGCVEVQTHDRNSYYLGEPLYRGDRTSIEEMIARAPRRSPLEAHVEPWLIEKLRKTPQPVLIVGSFPADADSVGSAVALCRFLKTQGIEAKAVFDGELPGNLLQLGRDEILTSADPEIRDGHFKSCVVLDGCEIDEARIGPVARLVAQVDTIFIIDHHHGNPTPHSLGLRKGQILHTWNETLADSASSMVLSLIAHMEQPLKHRGRLMSRKQWKSIAEPIAAGILTDTAFPDHLRKVSREALGQLRWMRDIKGLDLQHVEKGLQWKIPGSMQATLNKDVVSEPLPSAVTKAPVVCYAASSKMLKAAMRGDGTSTRCGGISPKQIDIINFLQDVLDREVPAGIDGKPGQADLGMLLVEVSDGVRFMVRSRVDPELPIRLAQEFGGGGKNFVAGGIIPDCNISEAKRRVAAWVAKAA